MVGRDLKPSRKSSQKRTREEEKLYGKNKKRKLDNEERTGWGEEVLTREMAKEEFLLNQDSKKLNMVGMIQKKLIPLTGGSLISTKIINELIREAVTLSHDAKNSKEYEKCVQLMADKEHRLPGQDT